MKKILPISVFVLAMVMGSLGVLNITPVNAAPPALCTSGAAIIVCGTNQQIMLRGVNTDGEHYYIGPGYSYSTGNQRNAIPAMKRWGANVLIQGVASGPILRDGTVNNLGQPVTQAQYLGFLDGIVNDTAAQGMYVVFVYRMPRVDSEQPSRPDAEAEQAMIALAGRYKNQSHVMYGTQVEPHDINGSYTGGWSSLRPQWERMIDGMRQAAAPAVPIIMVSGDRWARDLSEAPNNPVNRPNVVYKVHHYGDTQENRNLFMPAITAGLPVFFGEFGPDEASTVFTISQQYTIGWAAWQFWNEGHPELVQNLTTFDPTAWGTTVKNQLATTVTPSPVATATATTVPTQNTYLVYDDNEMNGWWEGAYTYRAKGCDTTQKTSGNCGLYADLNGYGGFNFGHDAGWTKGNYTHLTFDIRPNGQALSRFRLVISGNRSMLLSTVTTTQLANGWLRIRVPISETTITGIRIQNELSTSANRVWIDRVGFDVNSVAPTATPIPPTATPVPPTVTPMPSVVITCPGNVQVTTTGTGPYTHTIRCQ